MDREKTLTNEEVKNQLDNMNNVINFKKELEGLINKHCIENIPDMPDFLLADYLVDCIYQIAKHSKAKEKWYGGELGILSGRVVAKE